MGLIKMNGVNYWGSAYGQGIIAPMIYSTEEKEAGVYSDGKPLYQKAIELTNLNVIYTETDTYTNVDVSALSIDTMVDMCGWIERSWGTGSRFYNWGYYEKTSTYTIHSNIRWNKTGNVIQYTNTVPSGNTVPTALILIQYTKTTDTAGSGIYTPSGALAVHYSTNEQVIGTWINNKPLYEITFSQTLNNIASGVATNMADISGLNIDEIADISGRVNYYNGADWFNVNLGTYFGAYAYPTGYLKFLQTMTAQTTDRSYKVAITLRYTKTTD